MPGSDRIHIIIENEYSYKYYVNHHGSSLQKRIWYTTSPWLFEKLPLEGEKAVSLEKEVSHDFIHNLGIVSRDISENFTVLLDEHFHDFWPGVKTGQIFHSSIRRTLFSILYKVWLLDNWIKEINSLQETGIVVGTGSVKPAGLALGRFDTIFASLASLTQLTSTIRVMEIPPVEGELLTKRMSAVGQSRLERALLILGASPSLMAFKLWKYLLDSRAIHLGFCKPKLDIVFLKECELLEELFFPLLLRGCRIYKWRMKQEPSFANNTGRQEEATGHESGSDIFEKFKNRLEPLGFTNNGLFRAAIDLFAQILSNAETIRDSARDNLSELLSRLSNIKKASIENRPMVIVSSALPGFLQNGVYSISEDLNIALVICEHGITNGLSQVGEHWLEGNGMHPSHYGFCFTPNSEDYYTRTSIKYSQGFVAGMPDVNKYVKQKGIQSRLLKKPLGLRRDKRTVVYVASLYYNNYLYGPGSPSDTYYHDLKKTIVYEILAKIEDYCLLKLYPAFRYPDPDPFSGLLTLPPNIKAVQFVEYRYLRAVGDVILCDSPQSTLGWVWSTGVPLIFLDLPSNPLLSPIAEAFDRAIFRVDCSQQDWPGKVRDLLLLPHNELTRRWDDKKEDRNSVEEEYIFGPPGKASKRMARYIAEEVHRWPEWEKDN